MEEQFLDDVLPVIEKAEMPQQNITGIFRKGTHQLKLSGVDPRRISVVSDAVRFRANDHGTRLAHDLFNLNARHTFFDLTNDLGLQPIRWRDASRQNQRSEEQE